MKFDVVVVGGGLGGLVSAYILSKNGLGVLVLEKNRQLGGCLQTFTRGGVKFDTGIHYIGSLEPGQLMHQFFTYLNLLDDVPLSRLDSNAYDIVMLNGKTYSLASGYEGFVQSLAGGFPGQAADLRRYVQKIQQIANASPLYNLSKLGGTTFLQSEALSYSADELVASVTANGTLQSVLLGNAPLYAGVRGITPAYTHAIIANSYMQSAFRVVNGSDVIAQSLRSSIQRHGGMVRTNAQVNEFVCAADGRVEAVLLSSGERIEGQRFISNIHPYETLVRLKNSHIRNAYRERIAQLPSTISCMVLYLRFKPNAVPYLNSNLFCYFDNIDPLQPYSPEHFGHSFMFMHQCSEINQRYALGASLIAYMDYAEVQQWAGTVVGHRGAGYAEFMEQRAQVLLQRLEEVIPGITAQIEGYDISSPLTYQNYTATRRGAMYGVLRDKRSPLQSFISPRTKIPNLFFTGQNIQAHGVLGVIVGAIHTCSEIIGLSSIIERIGR